MRETLIIIFSILYILLIVMGAIIFIHWLFKMEEDEKKENKGEDNE